LEENNDDGYLESEWSNSKGMKNNLYTGGKDINWKFK